VTTATVLSIAAWSLLALDAAHIAVTVGLFHQTFADAVTSGWVNQFHAPDARRVAFWFAAFGPLLMLAGHVCVHAVRNHDLALLNILGTYLTALGLAGGLAIPRSPFWGAVLIGPVLIAGSNGWVT
jgi:Family of unknown function (DUF6463)